MRRIQLYYKNKELRKKRRDAMRKKKRDKFSMFNQIYNQRRTKALPTPLQIGFHHHSNNEKFDNISQASNEGGKQHPVPNILV